MLETGHEGRGEPWKRLSHHTVICFPPDPTLTKILTVAEAKLEEKEHSHSLVFTSNLDFKKWLGLGLITEWAGGRISEVSNI